MRVFIKFLKRFNQLAIRLFNIFTSLVLVILFSIPFLIIFVLVKLTSPGPAIHWSKRVGKDNVIFLMPKFRTMKINTPQVATHLMKEGETYLTPIGPLLRKMSLDELPQLYSVLAGHMSLVGPRPALFNQNDLVELRTKVGVNTLEPGVTGWAQINGRDDLSIPEKVKYDKEYMERRSLGFDVKIILLTAYKVLLRKNIAH